MGRLVAALTAGGWLATGRTQPARLPPMPVAFNMGPIGNYVGYFPFINLVKNTFENWNFIGSKADTTFDADGQAATITVGAGIRYNVWGPLFNGVHFIKGGQYVIKWDSGTRLTCSVSNTDGFSGFSQVGNRAVVTLPQITGPAAVNFIVAFKNDTGSLNGSSMTNFRVCHIDHEALMDAGEIFNPDWIALLGKRVKFIRCMKSLGTELGLSTLASQGRTESSIAWGRTKPATETGMPLTVCAKLAVKVGCDLHLCMPHHVTAQAEMDQIAAQFWSEPGFAASRWKVGVEMGNEWWNPGYGAQFSGLTAWGRTQTSAMYPNGLNFAQAVAKRSLMWWKAFENAGVPRHRLIRLFCPQAATTDNGSSSCWYVLDYTDEGNILGTNGTTKFRDLLKPLPSDRGRLGEIRTAAYAHLSDDATSASSQRFFARIGNLPWPTMTDAEIDRLLDNGIAYAATLIAASKKGFAVTNPTIPMSTYEFNLDVWYRMAGFAYQGYEHDVRAGDNTIGWIHVQTAKEAPVFLDGDRCLVYPGGPQLNQPMANASWKRAQGVYLRRVDESRARVYATQAAAVATYESDAAAQAASIPLDVPGSALPYVLQNVDALTRYRKRMQAYLDGEAGKGAYQRLCASQLAAGANELCQLYDFGYTDERSLDVSFWGLKAGIYAPDTPRSRWFVTQ